MRCYGVDDRVHGCFIEHLSNLHHTPSSHFMPDSWSDVAHSWPPTAESPPGPPLPTPSPYFIADSEAEQLRVQPLLAAVSQALSDISDAVEDGDGHQHFDRPLIALIAAYAELPLCLHHCHCEPNSSWQASKLTCPSQLPPASFIEQLHHRLHHPSLSAIDCHLIECQARVAALPADSTNTQPVVGTRLHICVWGPSHVWLEGEGVVDDGSPLHLQPPFLLLFFHARHMPTATLTYVHFHPSLASLRAELLLRCIDPYHDSISRIHAKQVDHAEDEQQPAMWSMTDPADAAWLLDRNVDTLRLLRQKLRHGQIGLAFHSARHL